MDMNKEKWINEVMNSLDDMKSAEANPFLYNKILNKIGSGEVEYAPMKLVWLAAASFTLLAVLNFQAMKKSGSSNMTEVQEIANAYNLVNTNSINYWYIAPLRGLNWWGCFLFYPYVVPTGLNRFKQQ